MKAQHSLARAVAPAVAPYRYLIVADPGRDVAPLLAVLSREAPRAAFDVAYASADTTAPARHITRLIGSGNFDAMLLVAPLSRLAIDDLLDAQAALDADLCVIWVENAVQADQVGDAEAAALLQRGVHACASADRPRSLVCLMDRLARDGRARRAAVTMASTLDVAMRTLAQLRSRRAALAALCETIRDLDQPEEIARKSAEVLIRELGRDGATVDVMTRLSAGWIDWLYLGQAVEGNWSEHDRHFIADVAERARLAIAHRTTRRELDSSNRRFTPAKRHDLN